MRQADLRNWREVSRLYRRLMGMALERKSGRAEVGSQRPITPLHEESFAARGIDVEGLSFVNHHQLPEQIEYFTHRKALHPTG